MIALHSAQLIGRMVKHVGCQQRFRRIIRQFFPFFLNFPYFLVHFILSQHTPRQKQEERKQ